MENSGKIVFGEDNPEWFIALRGDQRLGPLRPSEVYEKIQAGQITWAHFAWKKGQAEWKRICETRTFQAMAPRQPSGKPKAASQAAPSQVTKSWYIHQGGGQYGPFSNEELAGFIESGKTQPSVFAWRYGMKTWERLEQIQEFSSIKKRSLQQRGSQIPLKATNQTKETKERRKTPRRPLVAQILMSDDESVIVGVCRDISIGGLQVLTDRIPGQVGDKLKMNISPSGDKEKNSIEALVAEGVIVRILEDGRGFSFRFQKLPERSRRAIESYLESQGESGD